MDKVLDGMANELEALAAGLRRLSARFFLMDSELKFYVTYFAVFALASGIAALWRYLRIRPGAYRQGFLDGLREAERRATMRQGGERSCLEQA